MAPTVARGKPKRPQAPEDDTTRIDAAHEPAPKRRAGPVEESDSDDEAIAAPKACKAATAKDATGGGQLSQEQFMQLLQVFQDSRSGGAAEELDPSRFKNPRVRDAAAALREATEELKKDKRIDAGTGGRERAMTDGPRGAWSPDRRPHDIDAFSVSALTGLPGRWPVVVADAGLQAAVACCTCMNAC